VARGVNFWMAKEALARNPDMVFAAVVGASSLGRRHGRGPHGYYLDYVRTMASTARRSAT
jgi:RAB protein geranylgeranyltransferase component A